MFVSISVFLYIKFDWSLEMLYITDFCSVIEISAVRLQIFEWPFKFLDCDFRTLIKTFALPLLISALK